MSQEKRIEKMAKVIEITEQIARDAHCGYPSPRMIASDLYDKGYREQSEIAREIFEEIEKKVRASITVHLEEINKEHIQDTPLYDRHSGIIFAMQGMDVFIAELKKKYTEV